MTNAIANVRIWTTACRDAAQARAEAAIKLAPRPTPANLSPRAKAALQRAHERTSR